jgi:hypothetical protein
MVVGQSLTFSASGKDAEGGDVDIAPTWSVVLERIGTIDATGKFTAVGPGQTDVMATVGDIVGTASVTVEPPQPGSVDLVQGDKIMLTSKEGQGNAADGSRGEAKYELLVMDQAGERLGGATVTWTVENMGSEDASVVKAEHPPVSIEIPVQVPAGASVEFTTTANASGHVYITLDSENTTKVKITGAADGVSDAAMLSWQMAVPVELASFVGSLSKEGVALRWVAASQTNNYGWYIYRAVDRSEFARIGFVEGAGTTGEAKSYAFTDTDLPSGKVAAYYLRQINTDGTAGDSPTISVNLPLTAVKGENWGALKARFAQ